MIKALKLNGGDTEILWERKDDVSPPYNVMTITTELGYKVLFISDDEAKQLSNFISEFGG